VSSLCSPPHFLPPHFVLPLTSFPLTSFSSSHVLYYESMKRKLKIKPIYECRCNGRLQTKRFTRLAHTESCGLARSLSEFICSRLSLTVFFVKKKAKEFSFFFWDTLQSAGRLSCKLPVIERQGVRSHRPPSSRGIAPEEPRAALFQGIAPPLLTLSRETSDAGLSITQKSQECWE
jgi:hypothetical protein